jgi:cell division protein FtsA
MARGELTLAALDIGTTQVRAVIARCHPERGVHILGAAAKPAEGLCKSTVQDTAGVANIVRAALEDAEKDAATEVKDVLLSINGSHIHYTASVAVVNLIEDDTVTERHIQDVQEKARVNAAEKGRVIVHTIPQEYRLDGHAGVLNPLGMQAARVECSTHLITADHTLIENHARVVNEAGFNVSELCFAALADGHCVLQEQDKKEGVLLVDLGGGSSAYMVYANNTVYHSSVFAVGGDHVTNDLALGLSLTTPQAEELKCTYARLIRFTDATQDPNAIRVPGGDKKGRSVLRKDVDMIIDARIEELLQFIRDDVQQRQLRPMLARGVVFVGGGTQLHRFIERAEKIFDLPVRVGVPRILGPNEAHGPTDFWSDRHEFLRDTSFATVLGLVRHAFVAHLHTTAKRPGFLRRLFSLS